MIKISFRRVVYRVLQYRMRCFSIIIQYRHQEYGQRQLLASPQLQQQLSQYRATVGLPIAQGQHRLVISKIMALVLYSQSSLSSHSIRQGLYLYYRLQSRKLDMLEEGNSLGLVFLCHGLVYNSQKISADSVQIEGSRKPQGSTG